MKNKQELKFKKLLKNINEFADYASDLGYGQKFELSVAIANLQKSLVKEMTTPSPKYKIGQTVWFSDGCCHALHIRIQDIRFNEGEWQYLSDSGLDSWFNESEGV